jgi:hypothetical protein
MHDGTTRRRHDDGVEFRALRQFERTADGSFTKPTKLTKSTKKTRTLFDGLFVGGAALRAVVAVRAGVVTNGESR